MRSTPNDSGAEQSNADPHVGVHDDSHHGHGGANNRAHFPVVGDGIEDRSDHEHVGREDPSPKRSPLAKDLMHRTREGVVHPQRFAFVRNRGDGGEDQ